MKGKQGFASMDPEKRREICRMGGRAAHVAGTAHEYAKGEEARAAGSKGGKAPHRNRRGANGRTDQTA